VAVGAVMSTGFDAQCVTIPTRNGRDWVMIKGFLLFAVLFLVFTFPATWLLMLFLGNAGVHLSYWGTLPLGILVSVLVGGATSQFDLQ
jgi:hypothetical protein